MRYVAMATGCLDVCAPCIVEMRTKLSFEHYDAYKTHAECGFGLPSLMELLEVLTAKLPKTLYSLSNEGVVAHLCHRDVFHRSGHVKRCHERRW